MRRIRYMFLALLAVLMLSTCGNAGAEDREIRQSEQEEEAGGASVEETVEAQETQSGEDAVATEDGKETQTEEGASVSPDGTEKILIAYFSWAENAEQDDIDAMTSASVRAPGNVAQLASWIAEETGGELFSIQVTEPYPADWDGCLARANEEKADDIHPELMQTLENIEAYDRVYLGYPKL